VCFEFYSRILESVFFSVRGGEGCLLRSELASCLFEEGRAKEREDEEVRGGKEVGKGGSGCPFFCCSLSFDPQ